jgi:internalin A
MSELAKKLIAENKRTRKIFLDLGRCGLIEIPEEIRELEWLEGLSLADEWHEWNGQRWDRKESRNWAGTNRGLHSIGPVGSLLRLKYLYAGNTRIRDLFPLEKLINLQGLEIRETAIGDIWSLANLNKLQALVLVETMVMNIGALAKLANLQILNLAGTQVEDIGTLAKLLNLQQLDLSGTKVQDIGALANLSNLQKLDISSALVADLSPLRNSIDKGLSIKWSDDSWEGPGIYVKDCPLTNPPVEIVKQGNEAILNYWREREAGEVDHLYEAKMLLVGEGGAGKTSLFRRLYQPGQPLPTEQETTKGIAIYRHEFPFKKGRTFRLNVWDFGGQEIYHATHQFFLTRRSLYVLLDDTRKDHKSVSDEGFKYWLDLIDMFGDHSPVLIYQNEKGGRSKAIDLAGIKGKYDNVKECYAGNLESSGAADKLREAVEYFASQLSHIGEELPARWIKVRADIEARAKEVPHILQKEYFEIYARHLPPDRTKALHLSRYLHDLGVFLHFQDHPLLARTAILQNPWATEAVFRIIDDENIKGHRGRFTGDDCERLWHDSQYSEMHPELLALMELFELCYRLRDIQPETWLAPQLLPPAKPTALASWGKPDDLVLRYCYEFLPKGMISRLMVRLHRFVHDTEMAWTTGVLFERDTTLVLVELLPNGKEIELRARGSERKELLSVVSADLDAMNDAIEGLRDKVDKRIPCHCSACGKAGIPHFFSRKELLRRKQHGKLEVECPVSFEYPDVLQLLDGIQVTSMPAWAKKEPAAAQRILKIFLASSSELRADRDAFELYLRQQNDQYRSKGTYFEIKRWENFLDAMSETRLQDEYNKEVRACDIFVGLFFTKVGKYTEEEFDTAYGQFQSTGKPKIFTYFKDEPTKLGSLKKEDMNSLWALQEKLGKLGHFWTKYENIESLKRQFRDQLDKLLENPDCKDG